MFKVQKTQCETCIYRPDSPLDLKKLESEIADRHGGFNGHQICHHSEDVCCAGFWARHKDKFAVGQVAQRLKLVEFVKCDNFLPSEEIKMKSTQLEIEEILSRFGKFEILRWVENEGSSLLSIQSQETGVRYTHYVGACTKKEILAEVNSWMGRMVKGREYQHKTEQAAKQRQSTNS